MPDKLSDACRSLLKAKKSAQTRLVELDNERREVKAALKSLDAALKALGNSEQTPSQTKRAATTAEVSEIVREVLLVEGRQSMDQIVESVGSRLRDRGKSRSGLKLRLVQALKSELFVKDDDGFVYANRPSETEIETAGKTPDS